jgi:predicted mannosyl-3-phosphoglycerate phosphatase (HAD superfamily)
LRQTPCILYLEVDALIPARGKSVAGLDEFTAALDHEGIPAVWVTDRSRLEFDSARRGHGHTNPFIAEGGSGVYLPEGYFHLKPEKTVRLGRFTCIPAAQQLPAAGDALEELAAETGTEVVRLTSLSPRELAQNTGLPQREAELVRQRDFDELFFFAGASDRDVQRFAARAREKQLQLRQHGALWSLAAGANLKRCVQSLTKLYDRALRYHATSVGVVKDAENGELAVVVDRSVVLAQRIEGADESADGRPRRKRFNLRDGEVWAVLLEFLMAKGY